MISITSTVGTLTALSVSTNAELGRFDAAGVDRNEASCRQGAGLDHNVLVRNHRRADLDIRPNHDAPGRLVNHDARFCRRIIHRQREHLRDKRHRLIAVLLGILTVMLTVSSAVANGPPLDWIAN